MFYVGVNHALPLSAHYVEMQGMGDRIRLRRTELKLTQEQLGRMVGISKQAVGQWESGAAVPTGPNLVDCAEALKVRERWLSSGRAPKEPMVEPQRKTLDSGSARGTIGAGRPFTIEELDVRAAAGAGAMVESEGKIGEWSLPSTLVRVASNSAAEAIKILTVVGDSMPSSFRPYDKVMVDTLDRNPTPPGIFVVWEGLGLVVKRVMALPHSDPPAVRIISENPDYPPYERTLDEAYIQGRVLGKWLWV
jgi:phage repressor protein C with HTH and peptisase S24 domain